MPPLTAAVAVVLLDESGQVLLVRDSPNRWRLPGGPVQEGELPSETAGREALEEIGVHVELDHLIAMYELRGKLTGLRYVYAARLAGSESPRVVEDSGVFEIARFAPDDLPDHTTTIAPWGVGDAAAGASGLLRTIET